MTIRSILKVKQEYIYYNKILYTVFLWFPISGAFFCPHIHFKLRMAFWKACLRSKLYILSTLYFINLFLLKRFEKK